MSETVLRPLRVPELGSSEKLRDTPTVTYTQAGESGASLRAAGRQVVAQRPAQPGWDRPSGPRQATGTEGIPEAACCLEFFMFRGTEHGCTCPTRTTRSSAA
ncbi:hypothetical protein OKJ48_09150 [Streptomyces kunmingensis]|uniref:Uncharacterized protein n=1 Tax=Streptomyces kunmingensis TaxID=68225 RepID=A0ABU6C6S3_9ACTN|nr:hypothetical protein [Streptomyces kunmingensis]MEB3960412.1 hypothetical protein [Streptomyces kunmingensis]